MKVGEVGLVPRTGAEFMALETTAEAGTCLAWRSMLGLVGSSVGEGARCNSRRQLLGSAQSPPTALQHCPTHTLRAAARLSLPPQTGAPETESLGLHLSALLSLGWSE